MTTVQKVFFSFIGIGIGIENSVLEEE